MNSRPGDPPPTTATVSRPAVERRWCIPPAILHEPDETLEGSAVLDEVHGALGLLLWQSLRDVTLWAESAPERRGALFAPGAAEARMTLLGSARVDPAVQVPMATLAGLVSGPAEARAEVLSLVCREVSRWAEARGSGGTALAFAQAGALAAPQDAPAALGVGALAARLGRATRAETWLRRAVGLARRSGDWASYAGAYVELGRVYARRGAPEPARRFLFKALRTGRRHGLATARGSALHSLFLLSLEAGRHDEAERFARGAMRAYGRAHPRVAQLTMDVASLWIQRESYARAIPLLQKVLPAQEDPPRRAVAFSLLARAAAGAGERRTFRDAWTGAWALLPEVGDDETATAVLADLARAAATLQDWDRMEQAVRHAIAASARRGEAHLPGDVEGMMTSLRRGGR